MRLISGSILVALCLLATLKPVSANTTTGGGKIATAASVALVNNDIILTVITELPKSVVWKILTVKPDGSGLTALAQDDPNVQVIDGGWTPDKKQIRYYRAAKQSGGSWPEMNAYIMNTDGSNSHAIQFAEPLNLPFWSLDGKRIAYRCGQGPNWDICVVNNDGTTRKRVGTGVSARWSLDGNRLLYIVEQPARQQVFVMNADGSNQRLLTQFNFTSQVDVIARWAPDGSHILVTVTQNDTIEVSKGHVAVYRMNLDGSKLTKLFDDLSQDAFPSWVASPDGKYVAYVAREDHDIYVANADGTNPVKTPDDLVRTQLPSMDWSPDSTELAYTGKEVNGQPVLSFWNVGCIRLNKRCSASDIRTAELHMDQRDINHILVIDWSGENLH